MDNLEIKYHLFLEINKRLQLPSELDRQKYNCEFLT